nr:MAG: hypothetical protein H2BulkLitter121735_000003 [Mitovirus sp.]QDH90742.1 MAG: hypothetical protein H1BulkLitter4156_000003 [Mitovirus sp.]
MKCVILRRYCTDRKLTSHRGWLTFVGIFIRYWNHYGVGLCTSHLGKGNWITYFPRVDDALWLLLP